MKLVFFKEEDEIKLKLNQKNTNEDFNYVKLIEFLHENNGLEETEYCAEISEDEKATINEMIIKINEKIVSSGMD